MIFIPTYLYIKQHSITGKLYFGKTTQKDPIKYKGSGKLWKLHIKKHGREHVVTLWHHLYDNPFDLVADALSMSISLDIQSSESWLNLMVEDGIGAGSHSQETKEKLRLINLNKQHSKETKIKISEKNKGRVRTPESCKKFAELMTGEGNPMFGKHQSEESNQARSQATKGVPKPKVVCPHCGKVGGNGGMQTRHIPNCLKRALC